MVQIKSRSFLETLARGDFSACDVPHDLASAEHLVGGAGFFQREHSARIAPFDNPELFQRLDP
jgi:hypothetical protein